MNKKKLRITGLLLFGFAVFTGCATDGIYYGASAGRQPAVMVLSSIGGVTSHEHDFARRLAQAGYAAVVVDYLRKGSDEVEKEYDVLKSNPRIDPQRIGIVGFSRGAFEAISFAQHQHDFADRRVKAIVSLYIGPFIPTGPDTDHPATLFLHGDQDVHVSTQELHGYCDSKSKAGIVCQVHIYPGVRHAFDKVEPVYKGYNAVAGSDSWRRAIAFLDEYLRNAPRKSQ